MSVIIGDVQQFFAIVLFIKIFNNFFKPTNQDLIQKSKVSCLYNFGYQYNFLPETFAWHVGGVDVLSQLSKQGQCRVKEYRVVRERKGGMGYLNCNQDNNLNDVLIMA